jgi:hypothetical protein
MSRWIAALLVVVCALAVSVAQDTPKPEPKDPVRFPFSGSKSQLPFDVVEVDGKQAWSVAGRGSVRVEELVAGLSTATSLRLTYDASAADKAKNTIPYVGPDSGMLVKNAELADYVSDLLAGTNLTLVGHSTGRARVVTVNDAAGFARAIEPAELAVLPASEWVSLTRAGLDPELRAHRQLFDHFRSAQVRISMDDGAFSATGRVEQLRNVVAILAKIEAQGSGGQIVRAYDLSANLSAADAAGMLNALFATTTTSVDDLEGKGYRVRTEDRRDVTVSVVPGQKRVLVRASEADHRLVKAALDAAK